MDLDGYLNGDLISPLAKPGNVRVFYILGKLIGKGSFSKVFHATEKSTGRGGEFAVKIIKKKYIQKKKLIEREIEIMTSVRHENILWCKEVFEDENEIALVLEYIKGGELYDSIVDKEKYSETEAKKVIRQLLNAVEYLHSQGIAHRDLKPENLLCAEEGKERVIKVADFGLSKMFSHEDLISRCGSPTYIAPEVLECAKYSEAVDMWAIGVITFVLLTGCYPFFAEGKNYGALYRKIIDVNFAFPPDIELSEEAIEFIHVLLVKDPMQRYTPSQCKKHPWLHP